MKSYLVSILKRDDYCNHEFFLFDDYQTALNYCEEYYHQFDDNKIVPWAEDYNYVNDLHKRDDKSGRSVVWLISSFAEQYECVIEEIDLNIFDIDVDENTDTLYGWYWCDSMDYRDEPQVNIASTFEIAKKYTNDEVMERIEYYINGFSKPNLVHDRQITADVYPKEDDYMVILYLDGLDEVVRAIKIPYCHDKSSRKPTRFSRG